MAETFHLVCAACGQVLTAGCRIGPLDDYREDSQDREAPVQPGVMVILPEAVVLPIHHPDQTISERLVSPAGSIVVNPADVLQTALQQSGIDNGCCGSDGCDGPNRSCRCGQVSATQWADCWTQAEVRFLPDAVLVRSSS
ncbi:MAG: hypothetical protein Q7T61_03465 [Caulobacter sp.]|nr:hypothetical protein [Caulobacter sp.]